MPTLINFEPTEAAPVRTDPAPGQGADNTPNPNASESDALRAGEGAKVNTMSVSDFTPNGGGSGSGGSRVSLGGMVESKLVIELIDALIPALLVVLFRYAKMVVRKTDVQLTARERETLAPVVQACMDQLMLNFNSPWVALLVTGGAIYSAKVIEVYGTAQATAKAAPKEPGKPAQTTDKPADPAPPKPAQPAVKPWTEEDVKRLMVKRQKSREKTLEYLQRNWEKRGGNL